ncbi:MAG: glycosyltransferase [Pseudomonadota bacterium]|nr:glycosyltransferase [Pseudomonadota bacterium]
MSKLIVFSHLRWNFVFQRPQHLLSRLARHYPVTFIEEPIRAEGPARLERTQPMPGVEVIRPQTAVAVPGFHDDQLSVLQGLLSQHFAAEPAEDRVAWFYTPMALPLLAAAEPAAVVYDCMDELSAFKDAPRQMRQRESALLKRAQLVLTGGPSLYDAKRMLHRNVRCLPSAVDAAHYSAQAASAKTELVQRAEMLQGHIAGPRLGYFGVIDERLDLDLIAAVADAQPDWNIVMVGPVVKVDTARLPRRANIHWLGQQPYEVLPQLVAGWDVCMMPFALNESTRFISPTKTLEYMAAGKPVVSTGIHDVRTMFSDVVVIVGDHGAFIAACQAALRESPRAAAARQVRMQSAVRRYSWDETAEAIHRAIEEVLITAAASTPSADLASMVPSAAAARSLATPELKQAHRA